MVTSGIFIIFYLCEKERTGSHSGKYAGRDYLRHWKRQCRVELLCAAWLWQKVEA